MYVCMYVCMYVYELCVFCLLQHCRNSYVRWSHWFHIHMIFSSHSDYARCFTSRNGLRNYEHDPSY